MCCVQITGEETLQLVLAGNQELWFNLYILVAALINLYLAALIQRNK
jgi:hypothetical protein